MIFEMRNKSSACLELLVGGDLRERIAALVVVKRFFAAISRGALN